VPNLVLIPGLGTDRRLFEFLSTGNHQRHYVQWIPPEPSDTLASYALKLKEQVTAVPDPVLVGVSLGGILAMELREILPVRQTILVSSIKQREEMPPYFRWLSRTHADALLPVSVLKKSAPWVRPFLCGPGNDAAFDLIRDMIHDADERFIRWAIGAVLQWERHAYSPGNLSHIHGDADLVFPIRYVKDCTRVVHHGAHDMILTKATEISNLLEQLLM
jgi:pimeloyl-ACP methyl ester carboxylesterase